jgi:hypothetical protein
VTGDFTYDVKAVLKPAELRARRRREDCDLAILALIAVLRYGFAIEVAIESEASFNVV